jgi:hypothetical protein
VKRKQKQHVAKRGKFQTCSGRADLTQTHHLSEQQKGLDRHHRKWEGKGMGGILQEGAGFGDYLLGCLNLLKSRGGFGVLRVRVGV